MPTTAALIALDWGTTRLRAYLLGMDGTILEARAEPQGIMQGASGDFDGVFSAIVKPWLTRHGRLPAIAAGMIGSRQGWKEAPYAPCPAGAADIARQLIPVDSAVGIRLWLAPGVSYEDNAGIPDVMRGEETQILGALPNIPRPSRQLFVLPGTHSKWARVEAGRIVWFATFMTGEVFAVLREHSILGRLMVGREPDPAAFRRGLMLAADRDPAHGGLLKHLFSARTLGLFAQLPGAGLHAYLSGLLIGAEIEEAVACLGGVGADDVIIIVGTDALAALYHEALTQRGLRAEVGTSTAVVVGLYQIARDAGLLENVDG
ncbi:MAG: 2-dehydro-3-deoxygalactonokinase [Gammaproteobacteria bacterium]